MKFKDYLYHLVNLSTPQKKMQITYIHSKFKMILIHYKISTCTLEIGCWAFDKGMHKSKGGGSHLEFKFLKLIQC